MIAYVGKICLVDLAGSEDNNLTGNDPQRMREVSRSSQGSEKSFDLSDPIRN